VNTKRESRLSRTARATLTAALIASLAACGTVTRGTRQSFYVATTPDDAQVATSAGPSCDTTPCVLRMKRKRDFDVTISKRGYKPTRAHVASEVSGGGVAVTLVGNAVLGGPIGMTVDALDGAPMRLKPNRLNVGLERLVTLGVTLAGPTVVGGTARAQGVRIGSVVPRSAAERSGLRTGDTLTKLNGRWVNSPGDLVDALTSIQPATLAPATIVRTNGASEIAIQF